MCDFEIHSERPVKAIFQTKQQINKKLTTNHQKNPHILN